MRWRRRPAPSTTGQVFQQAYEDVRRYSVPGAVQVAREWAAWAVGASDVAQAAEAHWRLVSAIQEEALDLLFRRDRIGFLASVQGTAADAGHWLIRGNRRRDAALALESARAVLLGDVLWRDPERVRLALEARGRMDLYDLYADAVRQLAQAEREQDQGPRAECKTSISLHGRTLSAEWISPTQVATRDHQRIGREIGRVLADHPATPRPTYDQLMAAAVDGPLIYLAAATDTGFALIVTGEGEPRQVLLPRLKAEDLRALADDFSGGEGVRPEWLPRTVAKALDWLSETVGAELAPVLPAGSIATLVPVGALGLLPVHTALEDAAGIAVRYAPNARSLLRARARAQRHAGTTPRVLAVAVPQASGHDALKHATLEAAAVRALYGGSDGASPGPAIRDAVLRELDVHDVWHLACHGINMPTDPLESALLMEDGPLRLRDLLRRPAGRHRLAVLSACETNVPDPALLDEVVSLPSALLQTGVAGVVGSHWRVDDRAAALLTLRFHQRWLQGVDPARALMEAQRWLRSSTNEDMQAVWPELCAPPVGCVGDRLAAWRARVPYSRPVYWAAFSYTGA
jgi:hypothetical protein